MERIFQIVAVIMTVIAAYFLWKGNADGAFVSAVVGAVCFFISVRFQVKERNKVREREENFEPYELEEKQDFDDADETVDIEKEKQKIER